jgi:hypothetical protein
MSTSRQPGPGLLMSAPVRFDRVAGLLRDEVGVDGRARGQAGHRHRYVFDLRTAQHPLVSMAYVRAAPTRIHVGFTGLTTQRGVVTGPRPASVSFKMYENGTVSALIDTKRRAGFRAMLLTHPTRVVVDIASKEGQPASGASRR